MIGQNYWSGIFIVFFVIDCALGFERKFLFANFFIQGNIEGRTWMIGYPYLLLTVNVII